MCASFKDYIRSGGRLTRSMILRLIDEHDALSEEVRRLQRRQAQLEDKLEAQVLACRTTERRLNEREEEVGRLRQEMTQQTPQEAAESSPKNRQKAKQVDKLVARLEQRIENLLADLNRLRARAEEAAGEARQDERNRLLAGIGGLMDSLDRAIEMSDGPWREGLLAMESQFVQFLNEEGVQSVGEEGEVMDPRIHRAVDQVMGSRFEKGQIVEVRRRGFRLEDGRVIRPAEVVVAG